MFTENKLGYVKERFELRKRELMTRLLEQGYPRERAENILAEAKFSSRNEALQNKTKTSRNGFPFIKTLNPATPHLKKVFMKHWHLVTASNRENFRLQEGQVPQRPSGQS